LLPAWGSEKLIPIWFEIKANKKELSSGIIIEAAREARNVKAGTGMVPDFGPNQKIQKQKVQQEQREAMKHTWSLISELRI
jgi:hypothetical protein